MMWFKDGEPQKFTADDFIALLKERRALKDQNMDLQIRLVSAEKGWDDALARAARAQRGFDEAHLQRTRADRLEAIIEVMNESLMKLVDDSNSTLYNDREVDIS